MIFPDISNHQPGFHETLIKRQPALIHKATEGSTYTDPYFLPRSEYRTLIPYHFLRGTSDGYQQGEHFCRVISAAGIPVRTPVVIDVEVTDGLGARRLVYTTDRFRDRCIQHGYTNVVIYTSPGFVSHQLGNPAASWAEKYKLWVAHWGVKTPAVPRGWANKGWWLWQFTSDGSVAGYHGRLDLNLFPGTFRELMGEVHGKPDVYMNNEMWNWLRYDFLTKHYVPRYYDRLWKKWTSDPALAASIVERFKGK